MKILIQILWYLGVAAAAAVLIAGVFLRSWPLSLAGFALAMTLKATNKYIPVHKFYEKMGVKNEMFEGKVNHEKDHKRA